MLVAARTFVLKSPVWLSVACVVLCSVGGSLGAMFLLGLVLGTPHDWMFGRALAIATIVPTVVSWPVSLLIIRLLHDVEDARAIAQRLAWNDELTGSLNRRRFAEIVRREIIGADRTGNPLTVALLDLDELFNRADHAMYRAKQSGKNRVMLAESA